MFTIKITARGRTELKEIKQIYQEGINVAIETLKETPFLGKPLTRELIGQYSYKIGVYRIIYTINKKDKTITILTAGNRATIYNR